MKIVIPSRWRPETINKDTLRFIPKEEYKNTYVFVNPQEQLNEYKKYWHKDINYIPVPFTWNIAKVKNYMLDYFKEWQELLILDDDITKIRDYKNNKYTSLIDIAQSSFELLKKLNLKLFWYEATWNILNCWRVLSMFWFAIQVVWIINTNKLRYNEDYKTKEDIYLSCLSKELFWWTLIDYRYAFSAKARTNKWGCQEYRNLELEIENKTKLLERFPTLIKEHPKRQEDVIKLPSKRFYI